MTYDGNPDPIGRWLIGHRVAIARGGAGFVIIGAAFVLYVGLTEGLAQSMAGGLSAVASGLLILFLSRSWKRPEEVQRSKQDG